MIDSSSWTGRPSALKIDSDDDFGMTEAEWASLRWESLIERHVHRLKALGAIWGPAIRSAPRDQRKGWTIYDGHQRQRGDDWTLWRSIRCTIAIVLGRYYRDHHGPSWDRMDLGYFDASPSGESWVRIDLHRRCRVTIERDSM